MTQDWSAGIFWFLHFCVDEIRPIPLLPTDANAVIADKRIQHFHNSYKSFVKRNAIRMDDVSVLFHFRRPRLYCDQREKSMHFWNNQNWTIIIPRKHIPFCKRFEWRLFLAVSDPSCLLVDTFLNNWHELALLQESQVLSKPWSKRKIKASYWKELSCCPSHQFQ